MDDIKESIKAYRKYRLSKLVELTDVDFIDLTTSQEDQLLEIILNMPIEKQNLLIFKNYYNHSFDEIEDIFNMENSEGEYLHLVGSLSELLNLDKACISSSSMKKVCERVAIIINEEIDNEYEKFIRKDKVLIFNSFFSKKFISSVASVVIICILFIGVNTYAEGRLFNWIVEKFRKSTSFNITKENEIDKNSLNIEITYIPDGFELNNSTLLKDSDTYYYVNKDKFLVMVFVYEEVSIQLDTENVDQREIEIEGKKIITWQKGNENYYVLDKYGVGCQIYGNIDEEELIKIYKGILIK